MSVAACGGGGNAPAPNQPAGNQPSGNQPSGNQPSGNQPSGNQPSGNQPSGTPPANPIVLRVGYHEPANGAFDLAFQDIAAQIEAKTNGACKLELFPGELLGKGADMVSMVVNGVADIGWVVSAFFPGQFPITEVSNLPMMGIRDSRVGAKSLWDFSQVTPEIIEEWSYGMHLLTFTTSGYQFISTASKQVFVPDDLKGLKIRVAGSIPSRFIEVVGGSPVSLPKPDIYEAMDKGVIDGFSLDWLGSDSSKLQEVTNYVMDMPFLTVPHGIIMNQAKWDALPDDIKAVFDEVFGVNATQVFGTAWDESDAPLSRDFAAMPGRTITSVTDAQAALWRDSARPIWDEWIDAMDAKGLDGQAMLDKFLGFVEQNTKSIPKAG